jgi:hypothetical protein
LNQLSDDLAAGTPLETKYTVRQVRVIPKPSGKDTKGHLGQEPRKP